jgi:PhzF family phenazine biosynthesis protein
MLELDRPSAEKHMKLLKIAAFSDGAIGGNPAGIALCETLPAVAEMQRIAAEVGFSETAFAAPAGDAWRVRYFAPESEVPFCGHATIALGAALAMTQGNRVFGLKLNNSAISVEGRLSGNDLTAALQSPPTRSTAPERSQIADALRLFALTANDLDDAIPPGAIFAGADHLVFALKSRSRLAAMNYDLKQGQRFMRASGLVTIALVYARDAQHFDVRNAFASGGVLEDPATGAAAAAFAGYLRDLDWPHAGVIDIVQGEDMGMRSLIHAEIPTARGSSIRVSGQARIMT